MAAKRKTATEKTGKKAGKSRIPAKQSAKKTKTKKMAPAGGSGVVYLDPLREALARRFGQR